MNVSFKTIGQNLKTARKANHLSQEQTANLLGMSPLHYGRLERGERKASLPQLVAAAEVLHVSFSSLMQGSISSLESGALRNADKLSACSSDTLELINELIEVLIKHDSHRRA